MSDLRPPWQDLIAVAEGELVIRLVNPKDYVPHVPAGTRILPAALASYDFDPKPTSYGASVFVKALLARGFEDLVDACPRWASYRFANVPVGAFTERGVSVRLSPHDCEFAKIRDAHASLIGVTKKLRPALLKLIEAYLVEA